MERFNLKEDCLKSVSRELFDLTVEGEGETAVYRYTWDGLASEVFFAQLTDAQGNNLGLNTVAKATDYLKGFEKDATALTNLAEEFYMDEFQIQQNDTAMKDAYRKEEGLLTSKEIIVVYMVAGVACFLCFLIYLIEYICDYNIVLAKTNIHTMKRTLYLLIFILLYRCSCFLGDFRHYFS